MVGLGMILNYNIMFPLTVSVYLICYSILWTLSKKKKCLGYLSIESPLLKKHNDNNNNELHNNNHNKVFPNLINIFFPRSVRSPRINVK